MAFSRDEDRRPLELRRDDKAWNSEEKLRRTGEKKSRRPIAQKPPEAASA
jgi:hypothetical protein